MSQTETDGEPDAITVKANALATATDADVLVFSGPLDRPSDDDVIDQVNARRRRRPNVLLFVTTNGGSADAAYRIARCLQAKYKKVTAVVPGFCKSAGTLLVLGAHNLVMFDHAELGPLDVQLWKQDELGERSSGLAPTQAFMSLDAHVRDALRGMIVDLKMELNFTTKTAGELASKVVSQLYGGVYAQFDPLRIGETQRAQAVGHQYGRRLIETSKIADLRALTRLVSGYPSHGFVIDFAEAKTLFRGKVRAPCDEECELEAEIHGAARTPIDGSKALTMFLNEEVGDDGQEAGASGNASDNHQGDIAGAPAGTTSGGEQPGEGRA